LFTDDPVGFHGLRIECAASLIGFRGASHLYLFDDLSRLRCRHGLDGCCCRSDFIGLSCFRWPSRFCRVHGFCRASELDELDRFGRLRDFCAMATSVGWLISVGLMASARCASSAG
jgi:hypothetical protein